MESKMKCMWCELEAKHWLRKKEDIQEYEDIIQNHIHITKEHPEVIEIAMEG